MSQSLYLFAADHSLQFDNSYMCNSIFLYTNFICMFYFVQSQNKCNIITPSLQKYIFTLETEKIICFAFNNMVY